MAAKDKHTVSLEIEAKNLASAELEAAARQVDKLGSHVDKTETLLDDLKMDQVNLESFSELSVELTQLKKALAAAEVAFENQSKVLKANKKATDGDREALKLQKQALNDQRRELRAVRKEYDDVTKKIKGKVRVDETLVDAQKRIALETAVVGKEVIRLNTVYDKQVAKTQEKIAARQREIVTERELVASADKIIAANKRQIEADDKRVAANEALQKKLVEYQMILVRLNVERDKGVLSAEQYMRAEVELREKLELTSGAVRDRKRLTEAEAEATRKAVQQKKQAIAEEIAAHERRERAIQESIEAQIKSEQASRQAALAEKQAAQGSQVAISQYETAIRKLIKQKNKNKISSEEFAQAEAKLRKRLKLTKTQVESTRLSLEKYDKTQKKSARSTDALTKVTRRLAQAYTVLIAAQQSAQLLTQSAGSYGDLEAAMIGVEKTTGAARDEIEQLTAQLVEMSTEVTPTAANELAGMAQVAGQLGVKGSADISKLVLTVDALENSTNLAGEEAATLLTRILNLTDEGVTNIDRLGSVFVELGNNFAVAEDEIAHMTKEVVTGTAAIDLGSASAAAFGAALKVSGQQAERSRSAMFRLSQSIKQAVLEGGGDLEHLAQLTGMTADQIEQNLGERPQEVLLATIKGFAGVRAEGGLLTDTLSRMGINGVESTAVLEALAKNVGTLEEMLGKANHQWHENTALTEEALKAYASQNAAVGRLKNSFEQLKVQIGESLSDEVQEGTERMTELFEGMQSTLTKITENMVLFGEGVVEFVEDIDLVSQGAINLSNAWDLVYNSVRIAHNATTGIIKATHEAVQGYTTTFKVMTGAAKESVDESLEQTKRLREAHRRDWDDLGESVADMLGTSSEAYRDFIETAIEYGHLLGGLTEKEREQYDALLASDMANRNLDSQRIKMTATLVKLRREEEAQINHKKQQLKLRKQEIEDAKQAQVDAIKLLETRSRVNEQLKKMGITHKQAAVELVKLKAEMREMVEVSDETKERFEFLTEATRQYQNSLMVGRIEKQVEAVTELSESVEELSLSFEGGEDDLQKWSESTEGLNKNLKALNESIGDAQKLEKALRKELEAVQKARDEGKLGLEEYTKELVRLDKALKAVNESLEKATAAQKAAHDILVSSLKNLSNAELELMDALHGHKEALRDVRKELDKANHSAEEQLDLLREQKRLTEELEETERRLALTRELQVKTFDQLREAQTKHNVELEKLDELFRKGTINAQEYLERKQELAATTEILNELLGDSVELNEKDADATNAAADARLRLLDVTDELVEATEKVRGANQSSNVTIVRNTEATSMLAQTQAETAKQSGYASMATEELRAKLSELETQIGKTHSTGSGWWADVKASQRVMLQQERSVVTQTLALREWESQVASGTMSLSQLEDMGHSVTDRLTDLDDAQLDGLVGQIESAKNELRSAREEADAFAESVQDALSSAEERMYQLNGEQEKLLNAQYDAEVADLEKLRQQAADQGSSDQIANIQQAMRLTEQARQKELEGIAATRREEQLRFEEEQARAQELTEQSVTSTQPVMVNQPTSVDADRIAELEAQIQQLQSSDTPTNSGGPTTIVLQSGDQKAYINGIVDEVIAVLAEAGLRV